jgi:predicted CxxxxCH...CXXCH cytochrome family protein
LTSNAHNEHLNNGYGIVACADCHTAASNSNHINKNINIDNTKATYSRGASVAIGGTPSGTCLTSGCHNRAAVQSAAWNTAGDLACNACHGDASSGLSTSHTDHISAGKLCTQCHGAAPTTTAHIGGKSSLIDGSNADPGEASVLFTHADAVTDYTYNSSERSCYSPTNNGLGCHATAGSAGAADPTRPDWDVAFASTACTNCHTNTTTTAVNPTSGLHGVTPSVTGQRHNNTLAGGCVSCHTSVPQFGTHKNGTFTGGAGQTALMGLAGFYAQSADNTGTCSATSCHSGRDDWAHKWDTTTNYYTTSPSACNGCHGMALASANLGNAGVTHLAIDAMHNTGTNYLCKDCHNLEAASGYTFAFGSADWRPLDSLSSHGDGQIQINSNGTAYNESTGYCTGCHSSGPFNFADTGWTIAYAAGDSINANCGSCHGYPPTPGDGKANQAVEGKGAHAKHVSHIAALVGVPLDPNTDTYTTGASLAVCGVCHDVSTSANHHTGGGTRNLLLASSYQFGASAPAFNGTVGVSSSVNPKSCSSLDCHYQGTPVWAPVGGE